VGVTAGVVDAVAEAVAFAVEVAGAAVGVAVFAAEAAGVVVVVVVPVVVAVDAVAVVVVSVAEVADVLVVVVAGEPVAELVCFVAAAYYYFVRLADAAEPDLNWQPCLHCLLLYLQVRHDLYWQTDYGLCLLFAGALPAHL